MLLVTVLLIPMEIGWTSDLTRQFAGAPFPAVQAVDQPTIPFWRQIIWSCYLALALAVYIGYRAPQVYSDRKHGFPQRYAQWTKSLRCDDCGWQFVPQSLADRGPVSRAPDLAKAFSWDERHARHWLPLQVVKMLLVTLAFLSLVEVLEGQGPMHWLNLVLSSGALGWLIARGVRLRREIKKRQRAAAAGCTKGAVAPV